MSLSILVVGSGPAGCYVVEQLLKKNIPITIDIIDKNPYPFGLLRTGVAPDHVKIKGLQSYFERFLASPSVSFYSNVEFGKDIMYSDVKKYYDGIFICTGSATDNLHDKLDYTHPLNCGSLPVVSWYNGHPFDKNKFDPTLLKHTVGIIGLGNVALDIARILLKPIDQLTQTEMPEIALNNLSEKNISDVHIFVRRGPAQAKCTPKELAEIVELENISCHLHDFFLSDIDQEEALASNRVKKNIDVFNSIGSKPKNKKKTLHFHFFSKLNKCTYNPTDCELLFNKTTLSGNAHKQRLIETDKTYSLRTNFLISSIGYRGSKLNEVPFNNKTYTIANNQGYISDNLFTAGWIKRGPTGVVGTNKKDACETVESFFNYHESNPKKIKQSLILSKLLKSKKCDYFTYDDWKKIDQIERQLGSQQNKTRIKFSNLEKIKSLLDS